MNVEVRPGLRIPTWVPRSVAAAACEEYDAAVDELYLPKFPLPLLSDERMRGVWLELQRRRSGGGFLHPADRSISAASAEERQAVAMEMLFRAAVKYTIRPGLTMTRQTEEENSLMDMEGGRFDNGWGDDADVRALHTWRRPIGY